MEQPVTTAPRPRTIHFTVNGVPQTAIVEPRRSLLDCLRDDLHLHGTHVGCEHGVCGACNVLVDGEVVRSCLMLAVQADGCEIRTVEGLEAGGALSPMQEAFCRYHALQCGYCTPGILITLEGLLRENPQPSDEELIDALSGNLCRCTGYQQILEAARAVIRGETASREVPV
ncbi:MAG TPA: (2Fe-2S)-binding protein [Candidatus Dormibacteraeota bacterium]|jgi:carbon-monoxide dehydrogenase small subunit|nr:(2Fe-2S)-binding protein [Candidatus Dormibacteraeota bacterium]